MFVDSSLLHFQNFHLVGPNYFTFTLGKRISEYLGVTFLESVTQKVDTFQTKRYRTPADILLRIKTNKIQR